MTPLIPIEESRRWLIGAVMGLGTATVSAVALLFILPPSGLPSHFQCWMSSPGLIATHLVGDLMIWIAYMAIPGLILYLMVAGRLSNSSPITFPTLICWGALFVWCCGQTHLLDAFEIWWQIQWARGIVKLLTGIVSWVFVALLFWQRRRLLSVARAVHRAAIEEEAE